MEACLGEILITVTTASCVKPHMVMLQKNLMLAVLKVQSYLSYYNVISNIAPAMAPTNVSTHGCTIYWSYPDSDDVDGYVIYTGFGETLTTSTNYTIENPTEESIIEIHSTWSVSVRAYQHLIGPANEVTIGT